MSEDSDPLDDLVDELDEEGSDNGSNREQTAPLDADEDTDIDPNTVDDPAVDSEGETAAVSGPAGRDTDATEQNSGSRSGPLGNLADELDQREKQHDVTDDDLFDEESVADIDPETVWEQIETEDPDPSPAEADETRPERVIDSGTYCERCEYFSEPSDVHCTHEGTEILEVVDVDHFRVSNCPIVREDERLEKL